MSVDRDAELAAIGGKIPQIQRRQYTSIREVEDEEEEDHTFFRYIVSGSDEDDILVCGSCQCPMTTCIVSSFVTGMFVFVFCIFAMNSLTAAPTCLPAPFLYVSCHGHHNILKYTRDGCLITDSVLSYDNDDLLGFDSSNYTYRGMVTGTYGNTGKFLSSTGPNRHINLTMNQSNILSSSSPSSTSSYIYTGSNRATGNALFVANAKGDSQVTVFGACISNYTDPFSVKFDHRTSVEKHDKKVGLGIRKRIADLVQESSVLGARHGYGIDIDKDGHLYVSFQDTSVVLRFDPATGYSPMPTLVNYNFTTYEGAIFSAGPMLPSNEIKKGSKGVRGIAVVEDSLWVADEIKNSVLIIDLVTGNLLNTVAVTNPIGIHYDAGGTEYVFIGSKGKYGAEVLAFHRHSADKYHKTYYAEGILKHPAGITSYNGTLYVADQGLNSVFKFDIESGKYLGVIAKLGEKIEKYTIEGLMMSDC